MVPPLEQQRVADEFEPGGKLESGIIEKLLESVCRHIFGVLDFILVDIEIDVCLDKEDVIDWKAGISDSS